MATNNHSISGYSSVNGLDMYYEVHGNGKPLVLIHGGGSTIQTTFGNILPLLAQNRQVIAMELQAHGHTNDRKVHSTFEQDADDVAALLTKLQIEKADVLGFSNGAQTAMEMVFRHPQLVNKLILASTFTRRDVAPPEFWNGFEGATLDMMPAVLRDGYLQANNSEAGLLNMFNRDVYRMKNFQGWTNEQVRSINVPTLIIHGNEDVGSLEHAVELKRLIPNAQLAIFPGGHGTYLGAVESLIDGRWPKFNATALIEEFLDQ